MHLKMTCLLPSILGPLLILFAGAASPVWAEEGIASDAEQVMALQARADRVAFNILSANRELCRYRRLDPGFTTHTLDLYPRRVHTELRAMQVSKTPSIAFIHTKDELPTDKIGAQITNKSGEALASWDRRVTYQLLQGSLLINGQPIALKGHTLCAVYLTRDRRSGLQGKTDGRTIALSGATIRLQPDDALAFVIAHELGHVLLGHTRKDWHGPHDIEAQADRAALYLMSNAGYDPYKALDTLGHMKSPLNDLAAFFSTEKSSKSRHCLIKAYLEDNVETLMKAGLKYPPGLDPLLSHGPPSSLNAG